MDSWGRLNVFVPRRLPMRSDLVRASESFYNESNNHGDTEVCLGVLRQLGFWFCTPSADLQPSTGGSLVVY